MKKLIAILLSANLLISSNVYAVPPEDNTVINQYKPLALQGNAEAQLQLGIVYLKGKDVAQDEAEGIKWIKLSAEQGNAPAQNILGMAYAFGKGVKENHDEGFKWLKKIC